MKRHQALPTQWHAREKLREKGQFWTPDWVATAMVAYVAGNGAREVFDPAVGAGAFFCAAKTIEAELGRPLQLRGTETDSQALNQALENGLVNLDLQGVTLQDFTTFGPRELLNAIVCNPPYIRHHRLDAPTKARLRAQSARTLGFNIDGRAGFHVYFLVHALTLLARGGRLAFILPADTFEGVFAPKLWHWITDNFNLEAVITFAPQASPFPGVDTNAVVAFIENALPRETLRWTRIENALPHELKRWVISGFDKDQAHSFSVCQRDLNEAKRTGFSRPPQTEIHDGPVLGDYARAMRGIATGANEFFFLTRAQAYELEIPSRFTIPAIGRTRDVESETITPATLDELDAKGRPTLLLSLDGSQTNLPNALKNYLARGEAMGLNQRVLIQTRRPWYRMETRAIPPILFAYLGRRSVRFIRNRAGVVPLTGFLCLYPHRDDDESIEKLWQLLRRPEVAANLTKVGKSYGDGAVKVEPRSLENLPLPSDAIQQSGLTSTRLF